MNIKACGGLPTAVTGRKILLNCQFYILAMTKNLNIFVARYMYICG